MFAKGMEQMLISHDWDRYRKFLDLLEPHLDEELHDWEQEIEQQALGIEDLDQRDEFYHLYLDDYHILKQHKVILMNSFFSASYALFEYHLTRLCNQAKRHHRSPFSVDDLRYSLSDRVKLYFARLKIPFPSNAPEWPRIKVYQEIRNKMMHDGGNVSCSWKHFAYAEENCIVDRRLGEFVLTRYFCEKALDDFRQFLLRTSGSITQSCPRDP